MKILSVTTNIPIPGVFEDNDVILVIYNQIKKRFPQCDVRVCRPVPYFPIKALLKSPKRRGYQDVIRQGEYATEYGNVWTFPVLMFTLNKLIHPYLVNAFHRFLSGKGEYYKNLDFDVIHANYCFPDALIADQLSQVLNIPFVVTVRSEKNVLRARMKSSVLVECLQRAAAITCFNATVKKDLLSFCSRDSTIIGHGVEERFFVKEIVEHDRPLKFLTVSRLLKLKNIDKILYALSTIEEEFEYTIVGDGPELNNLKAIAKDLGIIDRVHFKGRIPYQSIHLYYHDADIFVMVSYPETFGRVFLEAMASGLLVIGPKEYGISGLFKDTVEVILADHRSQHKINGVIKRAVSERRWIFDIRRRALRAVQGMRWGSICDKYMNVFKAVADKDYFNPMV